MIFLLNFEKLIDDKREHFASKLILKKGRQESKNYLFIIQTKKGIIQQLKELKVESVKRADEIRKEERKYRNGID